MAGYVIHLAVAKEYLRNFRIKDEKEFLRGISAPDLLSHGDKTTTHYSEHGGSGVNLKEFLKHNSISTEYMQGYFLHLVTDYLFYDGYKSKPSSNSRKTSGIEIQTNSSKERLFRRYITMDNWFSVVWFVSFII